MTESDKELLSKLINLVRIEKETTAEILKYLAEVDARRLWRSEGYSSLHDFCVRHLKYSDGEANRRIQSARSLAKFPAISPLLEAREVNLSTLSLLSPVLTEENHKELLSEAKNHSTREVEKIIKTHFPETATPRDRIRPIREEDSVVQFTADKETIDLIEQAKNQFRHINREGKLNDILKYALRKALAKPTPRPSKAVDERSRHIPMSIKRDYLNKKEAVCSFVSQSGVKCISKAFLQWDHIKPYALGGSSTDPKNIRILCFHHNQLMKERHFPNHRLSRERLQVEQWFSKATHVRNRVECKK